MWFKQKCKIYIEDIKKEIKNNPDSSRLIITISSIFLITMFVLVLLIAFILPRPAIFDSFDMSKHSDTGNAIGGILTPFIAIIAALLTFVAFWVQYAFNKIQRNDIEIERFERITFKLLDIYRDIVNNSSINNMIKGQLFFHFKFYEFKTIFEECNKNININGLIEVHNKRLIKLILLYISFEIFISGYSLERKYIISSKQEVDKLNKRIIRNLSNKFKINELAMQEALSENKKSLINIRNYILQRNIFSKKIKLNFITQKYIDQKVLILSGGLPTLKPYFQIVEHIINYFDEKENNDKNKNNLFLNSIETNKGLFKSLLCNHEIALIYIYMTCMKFEEYLLKDIPCDKVISKPEIPEIKYLIERLEKYKETFLWYDEGFLKVYD